jgi:hypothetical protein
MNEGVPARHARRVDRSSAIRRVAIVDLVGLTTATMTSPPPRATGLGAMPARGAVRRCCFSTRPAVSGGRLDPRLTAPSDETEQRPHAMRAEAPLLL